MESKIVIIFPYHGYEKETKRESLFLKTLNICRSLDKDRRPVIVVNKDTIEKHIKNDTAKPKSAQAFLDYYNGRENDFEKIEVWSVDTCQMWLAGWGHVLDNFPESERVILVPGDVDYVTNDQEFFAMFRSFLTQGEEGDIVLGDFESKNMFSSKNLIDYYGTYALMANWFPKITKEILNIPLYRTRTEFINIKLPVLRELLKFRKFAYEQTLNILIRSWDIDKNEFKYSIAIANLGKIEDDDTSRKYTDCLDQIERTERMLKMIWRDIQKPADEEAFDRYHDLDARSNSIRQNARIIIKNLLEVGGSNGKRMSVWASETVMSKN